MRLFYYENKCFISPVIYNHLWNPTIYKKRQDPSYHLIYVLSPFEEIKHKKCIIIIPFYKIHKIEPREKKTLKQTSVTDRLKREKREREGGEIGERDREKGERERGEREEREKGEKEGAKYV